MFLLKYRDKYCPKYIDNGRYNFTVTRCHLMVQHPHTGDYNYR